ncbi:MAG: AbrB/MazE/SpoVT family DNA-binding domain-containing protein [Planctomycetota bacterium]
MIKTLTKHGDQLALVIEKPILDLLGIDADTPLTIRSNGRGFYIAPANDPAALEELDQIMQQIEDRYENVFQKLAE